MTEIQTIIALLVAALVGLGLGSLRRRPRTDGTTPAPPRPEPVPDTHFDDEAHDETDAAAADTDARRPAADAVDAVISDLSRRRQD